MMTEKGCEVCDDVFDLKICSGCRQVSYCSIAHQREHWKVHKENCKPILPYKIEESSKTVSGKLCIAGKDYEQGAIIFEEFPLFHFNCPSPNYKVHQCVTCGLGITKHSLKKCSLCSWPVCSVECEKAPIHANNECKVFLENETSYPPSEKEGQDFEMIARAYSIRSQTSNIWDEILDIMPLFMLDEFNSMKDVLTNVLVEGKSVTPIKSIFPQFLFEHEPIVKNEIQAQLTVLSRRIGYLIRTDLKSCATASHIYMYKNASHLDHSCRPNVVWNIGPFPEFKIRLRAAVPIRRGQKLTVNRQGYLYFGTIERQRLNYQHFKHFCECKLCQDPSELSTMQSAITCIPCRESDPPKMGYLLPKKVANSNQTLDNLDAEWKCNVCDNIQPASTFMTRLEKIYKFVQKAQQSKSKLVAQREIEIVLKESGTFLHPNHWVIQQAVNNAIQCNTDMLIEDGNAEKLGRFTPEFEQCVEHMGYLINILDKTCPGLQHERARFLLLQGDAILTLCKSTFQGPTFASMDKEETLVLKTKLMMAVKYLDETLLYWSGTPLSRGSDKPNYVDNLIERITMGNSLLEHLETKIYDFRKKEEEADVKIEDWGMRYKK